MSFVVSSLATAFNENSYIDDFIDRTHRNLMVVFLVFCCLLVGSKQYVGDSISCYIQDRDSRKYAESYCWASSTYQILPDPDNSEQYVDVFHRSSEDSFGGSAGIKSFVSYYQWVPLVLCVQAVLFYLPYLLWRNMSKTSGIHLVQLLKGAHNLSSVQKNENARGFFLDDVEILLSKYLKQKHKRNSVIPRVPSLVLWFGISKCLYLLNVLFQLGSLHAFLKTPIVEHGLNLFKSFIFDMKWISSTRFPIRTICSYKGAVQMNNHVLNHQTHCVLPINLYNDKIYGVMALVFLILSVATVVGMLQWAARLFIPGFKSTVFFENKRKAQYFSSFQKQLGLDGYFILLLIERNVSTIAALAVVDTLYDAYEKEMQGGNDTPDSLESGPPHYKESPDSSVKRFMAESKL